MGEINISNLGLNLDLLEQLKKKPELVKKFDTLESALEHANTDSGDEVILKTKDDSQKDIFVVIDIKNKSKSSDIFDPSSSVKFPIVLISRDNKKIESVSEKLSSDDNEINATNEFESIAEGNNTKGLRWKDTGTIEGAATYQSNIKLVFDKITKTEKLLDTQKITFESNLKTAELEVPKNDEKISTIKNQIQKIDIRKQEIVTQKGILGVKLSVQPISNDSIPESDLKIGAFRKTPAQAIIALRTRIAILEKEIGTEKSPEKITSMKEQISKLNKEVDFVSNVGGEINSAAIRTNLRVGSLASINNSLGKATSELNSKLGVLKNLEQSLRDNPDETLKSNPNILADIRTIKNDINKIRLNLIDEMKSDIKNFEKNIPRHNNEAGKKAVDLLNGQIKLLEGLSGNKGSEILDIVKDTHKKLLGEIIEGAKQFKGIEPKEATMLSEIVNKTHSFVDTYKETQQLVKNLIVDVAKAKTLPIFLYTPPKTPALDSAQTWTPGTTGLTGIEANSVINSTYHKLNTEFNSYLGNPPISNWMTFGKFASREAGAQIKSLETALEAMKTLSLVDLNPSNDARAVNALLAVMEQDKMINQGIRMGASSMGITGASSMKAKDLIIAMTNEMEKSALPFLPSDPTNAGKAVLAKITPIISNLETLHSALVKGNTRIYDNIVPPFDIFMKAESSGNDGLKALKDAGYGKNNKGETYVSASNKDPQGFIMDAFKLYKESKNLADKIVLREKDGAPQSEIDKLKLERENVTHRANLLIGCQEQMAILQAPDIFNDPTVSSLLGAMTGTMSLKDTVGQTSLLPTDKGNHSSSENWSDFQTRMGVEEVKKGTKGAIEVQDSAGKTHYFVPIEKPASGVDKGEGTITRYFKERLSGSDSDKIIKGETDPMESEYLDNIQGQTGATDLVPTEIPETIYKGIGLLPKAYEQIF